MKYRWQILLPIMVVLLIGCKDQTAITPKCTTKAMNYQTFKQIPARTAFPNRGRQ